MTIQVAEIIFNDVQSKSNKELTDYLERNMNTAIVRGQIRFRFKIAKPRDIKDLHNRGYKKFPAMTVNNRDKYMGVGEIVSQIVKIVRNSKTVAKPKSEDEILNAYFQEQMGDVKKDSDGKFVLPKNGNDDEADQVDLGELHQRELQRRNLAKEGGVYSNDNPAEDEDDISVPRVRDYFKTDDTGKKKKGKKRNDPAPSKPSRDIERDGDDEEDDQPMPRKPPRANNVQRDDPGDPKAALKRISQGGGGADDAMMQQLLDKLNDSEF